VKGLIELVVKAGCQVDFEAVAMVARKKNVEDLKFLLELLPDIDWVTFTDGSGQTLLHHARHLPVVEYLLSKNPKLAMVVDNNLETPIMKLLPLLATAKRKKHAKIKQICIFLQNNGVDIDKPNQQGYTVLHEALIKKYGGRKHLPLVIMTLLELGTNISKNPENNPQNMTTLHLACTTGLTQVVRQLLHYLGKSNPKILAEMSVAPTKDNFTPKQIAQQCGDTKMVEEIEAVVSKHSNGNVVDAVSLAKSKGLAAPLSIGTAKRSTRNLL